VNGGEYRVRFSWYLKCCHFWGWVWFLILVAFSCKPTENILKLIYAPESLEVAVVWAMNCGKAPGTILVWFSGRLYNGPLAPCKKFNFWKIHLKIFCLKEAVFYQFFESEENYFSQTIFCEKVASTKNKYHDEIFFCTVSSTDNQSAFPDKLCCKLVCCLLVLYCKFLSNKSSVILLLLRFVVLHSLNKVWCLLVQSSLKPIKIYDCCYGYLKLQNACPELKQCVKCFAFSNLQLAFRWC